MKKKKVIIAAACILFFVLLLAPYIAGLKQIGNRSGPFFYPEGFHTVIFIAGHEAATGIKPRSGITDLLYRRPYFWGLPMRPRGESERDEILKRMKERNPGSRLYEVILEHNQQLNMEANQAR